MMVVDTFWSFGVVYTPNTQYTQYWRRLRHQVNKIFQATHLKYEHEYHIDYKKHISNFRRSDWVQEESGCKNRVKN